MADANANTDVSPHAHAHHHHHHHQQDTPGDVDHAKLNREHYDAQAEKYDDIPHAKEMCAHIGQEFVKACGLHKECSEVLDFACGTGLISKELVPHAKTVLGVDISQGVVDVYNRRFAEQGLAPGVVHAIRKELTGAEDELDGKKYDVITCSMAYHHFASPATMTRILAGHLKPSGMIIIADRIKNATSHIAPKEMAEMANVPTGVVVHDHGFDMADMRSVFEGAGLKEFEFKHALSEPFANVVMEIFVAKGVKAD